MTNPSGIEPLDLRVLVKPDPAEKRIGSIIIPDTAVEKDQWAMMKGTIVAIGACAWSEARSHRGFTTPDVGARVLVGKYAGVKITGNDGEEYKLLNDEDILGVIHE